MTDRHITWENFERSMVLPAVPAVHVVKGEPQVALFADSDAARIGLRVATLPTEVAASPVAAVAVRWVWIDGQSFLSISVDRRELFKAFYLLSIEIADLIQVSKMAPDAALSSALDNWKELLRDVSVLTEERQLGLLGELWALEMLLNGEGTKALTYWVGPKGEPHDFRFRSTELEVKACRSVDRRHRISSLSQLLPSQGHLLYLLSLQFEPAASGRSLPEVVNALRTQLSGQGLAEFDGHLRSLGYRGEHEDHYRDRYRLRSLASVIPVDDTCPRLIPATLSAALPALLLTRVHSVTYEVVVDGLGALEGTETFTKVFSS